MISIVCECVSVRLKGERIRRESEREESGAECDRMREAAEGEAERENQRMSMRNLCLEFL